MFQRILHPAPRRTPLQTLLPVAFLVAITWVITPATAAALPLEGGSPAAKAVLTALENSEYRFTPGVRAAYLCFRRQQAAAELSAHGITLPEDLWRWVESDPVVAATIYGTRRGSPAQALFVLRSLEIDLGPEVVRERHPQLALAAAWCYGETVDLAATASASNRATCFV